MTNDTTNGPVILVPLQSQVAVAGTNVIFTVSATGDAPLRYQWFFNRRAMADATNGTLVLSNVTVAQAGCYAAEVANPAGLAATPEARLEVIVPPIITRPLQNQSAAPGVNVAFYVAATGDAPLTYLWQFNGVPITGATGTALALTNVQSSHAGVYSVVISNHAGVATTAAFLGISIALLGGKGYESADDWAALLACVVIVFNGCRIFRTALGEIPCSHKFYRGRA